MTGNGHAACQAAEAGNNDRKDGSQPPFDTRLGHKDCPNRDFGLSLRSRMGECLLTARMSASGHQQTFRDVRVTSVLPLIADSERTSREVQNGPQADIWTGR
jgi:hypothetical protein